VITLTDEQLDFLKKLPDDGRKGRFMLAARTAMDRNGEGYDEVDLELMWENFCEKGPADYQWLLP